MRVTRLVSGLAAAGLIAATPLFVGTAPAQAADIASVVTLEPPTRPVVDFKDTVSFFGSVKGADAASPSSRGVVTLQVSTPKKKAWKTIASAEVYSSFYFSGIKAKSNASYKVVYSGGTTAQNTLLPGESAAVTIKVMRKLTAKTKGLKVSGKVSPKYKKKKVKILQVVSRNRTKLYTTIRTNKKSRFSFKAPNRRGFQFIVVIPKDRMFAETRKAYRVI